MKKSKKEVPVVFDNEILTNIEKNRVEFKNLYKKIEYFKWGVMVLCVILLIVSFLVIPNLFPKAEEGTSDPRPFTFMIIGAVLSLVPLVIYSIVSNRIKKQKIGQYFETYYGGFNTIVFGEDYKFESKPGDKVTVDEFNKTNLYKDVFGLPNRNLVVFTRGEKSYSIVDIAAQVKGTKMLQSVFVGKMISTDNKYEGDDGIIIYGKAKDTKLALPPTTIDQYNIVEDTDEYVIYSNSVNAKEYLTKALRDAVADLKIDEQLIDFSISIQKGSTFVCLGIDDSLMVVPYENPVKEAPIFDFKKHFEQAMKVIDLVK